MCPGAKDAQVAWNDTEYPIQVERVISYSAAATPQQIEAYYSDMLPKEGWTYGQKQSDAELGEGDSREYLLFAYSRATATIHSLGSNIKLYTQPADGGTQVEMRVGGYEMMGIYEREKGN